MVTGLVGLAGLALLIVMLVVALMVMPKKNSSQQFAPMLSASFEAAPLRSFSIRAQQLNEDADALAGEFKRVRYDQYLADLRTSAAAAFSSASSKTAKP